MTLNELVELKKKQQVELLEAAANFKDQLTDRNLSLEERWEIFGKLTEIGGVLKRQPWVCHSIDSYGLSWYDDFYIERHQKVDYYDLGETWEERIEMEEIKQEHFDSWREKILEQGMSGFTFDW